MGCKEIRDLVRAVEARHGAVTLHGSNLSEEFGTCFTVADVPATFSAHTQEGKLPPGLYDVQIEGLPPGDYIYTSVVPLEVFLGLVARVCGPEDDWPICDDQDSWQTMQADDVEKIADRAVDKFQAGGVEALSDMERLLVVIRGLEADVNNGGFDQYFLNSHGDYSSMAEDSLRRIGAHEMASILADARSVFGPDGPPADRAQRQEVLLRLPEDARRKFDELDSRFWPYPDDISALLARYLESNGYPI